MLINTKSLVGYKLHSLDGEIGKVKEFYFDDRHWTVRYLVADTKNWWPGKRILVSPLWIATISARDTGFPTRLSVRSRPEAKTQREAEPT
jgi:hypothetical protein